MPNIIDIDIDWIIDSEDFIRDAYESGLPVDTFIRLMEGGE